MHIRSIETYPVRIPLKAECRMVSALGRHDESEFVLLRLLTDSGLEGAGEATATARWSGETVWGVQALIDRILGPAVAGMELNHEKSTECIAAIAARMDQLAIHNWFAKSAIEMACWDALGKAADQPVYELLGGACRPLAIKGRFSIGAYDPPRAAARAAELAALGFDTLKVKVGGRAEEDIARVRAVRQAIGPERKLVIDANCGWDVSTAIRCVKELLDCNLLLVEQPTPDGDYAAIARVRRETGARVMADDMCFNLVHAQELVRNQACDVISVYPGKNGGIARSRSIAQFCESHGVATSIGSNLEFDVATAAMGHLIVATPNLQVEQYPGDIYGPAYYEFRVVKNPLEIRGPYTTITDRPGLGVEVDWELVRKNRCA